jgi:hypothetical protein
MKKTIMIAVCLAGLLLANPAQGVVRAQEGGECPYDGKVTYSGGGSYGFEITQAQKTAPEYPVIVTQDDHPVDADTGVDIGVEIVSYPGTVTYKTHAVECAGYERYQYGKESCEPYYSGGLYYHQYDVCIPHTETVYRYINKEQLQIWLVPSDKTKKWLGWTSTKEDEYPLRYLFPDKWQQGFWTPDGYTTLGSYGLYTEQGIEEFFAEHPEYDFLKADPRSIELPTKYLELADMEGEKAIPLFGGEFKSWGAGNNEIAAYGEGNRCIIRGVGPNGIGDCIIYTNYDDSPQFGQSVPMFGSLDIPEGDIWKLYLGFSRVPMDLPGEWYVAVSVSVFHAVYGVGVLDSDESTPGNDRLGKIETVGDDVKFYRKPGDGYYYIDVPEHTFLVWMWLSTPCDPKDEGCTN